MKRKRVHKELLMMTVTASLLAMPVCGYTFQKKPEYVYYNGKPMAELQFLSRGEKLEDITEKAGYTL